MKVVRALRVLAFVNDEVFTVLYRLKDVRAVRTTKLMSFGKSVIF